MSKRRNYLIGVSVVGMIAATATAGLASSHREAPGTAGMPRIDSTDVYLFRSYEPGREDFVTLIANYIPFQDPYGGPNYYTFDNDAIYEIHVDSDGDAIEDLTFQFDFDTTLARDGNSIRLDVGGERVAIPLRQGGPILEPNDATLNERESYTLAVIAGDRRSGERSEVEGPRDDGSFLKPVDNIGTKTLPDYEAYADQHLYDVDFPNCDGGGRVFVGQRAEAFAVNVGEIFDLVNLVPVQGEANPDFPAYDVATPFPGGIEQNPENDDLVGEKNVTSIALEVPIDCLVGEGNGTIGAWTTASLPQARLLDPSPSYDNRDVTGGALVQVSRLSAPLVNEIVIGLPDKDLFSAAEPRQDAALATYVTNPTLPALLDILFRDAVNSTLGTNIPNLAPTNFPRSDLVAAFLTGFEGLNQQEIVTASEMMRLNTGVAPTPRDEQSNFGVAGGDLAGFPNGRRPGDDVVDIELRVAMGALCYDLPIGDALGAPQNLVNLGICAPEDAAVGNVPFTDGAPISAVELKEEFPYLNYPIPGAPNDVE